MTTCVVCDRDFGGGDVFVTCCVCMDHYHANEKQGCGLDCASLCSTEIRVVNQK